MCSCNVKFLNFFLKLNEKTIFQSHSLFQSLLAIFLLRCGSLILIFSVFFEFCESFSIGFPSTFLIIYRSMKNYVFAKSSLIKCLQS